MGAPIQAVVLCGGVGARLRPLTYAVPKPLLPVGGRPILEHILDRLAAAALTEVALATGFRSELIEQHFGPAYRGTTLHYRREQEPLGTAGVLNLVRGAMAEVFVVTNGDLLTDIDVRALLDAHRDRGAAVTVCTRALPVEVAYGVVDVDGDRITRIREKPEVQVPINAGVYVLSAPIWELLPQGAFTLPELVNAAIAASLPTLAYSFDDYWIDIGAMPDYLRANLDLAVAAGQAQSER